MTKIQYRITEDDYVSSARLHLWRHMLRRPTTAQFVAIGFLAALAGMFLWVDPLLGITVVVTATASAILVASVFLILAPIRARRQYRQYRAMQETMAVELTENGLRFGNTDGEGILQWSKILRWRQNDRFILVYVMPILYYIVPKAIAKEGFDVQRLVQYLSEQVGPER